MKTLKKVSVDLVRIVNMPERESLLPNTIYYSEEYKGAGHLCLCGCGEQVWTPLGKDGWTLTEKDGKVTMTPSLAHRFECKSHYIITNGVANFV